MFEAFTRQPFKDRLKDTGYLLRHTFTIVGMDQDIKTPTLRMMRFQAIRTTLVFGSILTIILGGAVGVLAGVVVLALTFLVLKPYSIFYNVRQKAAQSWIVYNTLTGEDISYRDALTHVRSQRSQLRSIAFVDLAMKLAGGRRSGGGIRTMVVNLLLGVLREVWDLLSHYLTPAVVIEQRSIREIVPTIKDLRNNVPATLVGVFGLDFVGDVVGSVLWPIYLLLLAGSVGVGYLLALVTDATVVTFQGFSASWVPPFVALYFVFLAGGVVGKLVEGIKTIYFTIFYTAIQRPDSIAPALREDITHYLLKTETG